MAVGKNGAQNVAVSGGRGGQSLSAAATDAAETSIPLDFQLKSYPRQDSNL
jgi:hypothetical protein